MAVPVTCGPGVDALRSRAYPFFMDFNSLGLLVAAKDRALGGDRFLILRGPYVIDRLLEI